MRRTGVQEALRRQTTWVTRRVIRAAVAGHAVIDAAPLRVVQHVEALGTELQ